MRSTLDIYVERKEMAALLREHLFILKSHGLDEPCIQKLYDLIKATRELLDDYGDIPPKILFQIACHYTYVILREGVAQGEGLKTTAELNLELKRRSQLPRKGAKGKNLPSKKKLVAAFNRRKKRYPSAHGMKAGLAVDLRIGPSTLNRAVEHYIKEGNLTPNQNAAMNALRQKTRK